MKTLNQRYYDLSNTLLERSANVRVIGNKTVGNMIGFRKHYRSVLDIVGDLQAHADLAQEIIGDQAVTKQMAKIAVELATMKAILNARIAANTLNPTGVDMDGAL